MIPRSLHQVAAIEGMLVGKVAIARADDLRTNAGRASAAEWGFNDLREIVIISRLISPRKQAWSVLAINSIDQWIGDEKRGL